MSNLVSLPSAADPILAGLIDEYTALRRSGGPADPEAFARAHPEHAEALRRLLPALDVLDDLGRSAGYAARSGVPEATGVLGDFRLGREVGRGGMGVVYEAEQQSLRRRVALKVLPFAAALDARHLRRFQNEAQAAAHLHHTNIVPVYAVGCECGVHYYAMQLIEGQSLAEVLRTLRREGAPPPGAAPAALCAEPSTRSPSYFRGAARLGVQAAEALDYAHQQGVIHRDVKPANLLLDAAGRLWVTDFGLALSRSEPGLTGTGGVVGTLRYMSPEQALAKRALVDHRSDVYSLGVTLYEALVLEPAYPGSDREELLRQIADGAPRPPRRVNPAVPVELETVVLKAMAREPEDRYPTAQELADDLRRFLEDRPVLARRPPLGVRVVKWARRHRPAVTATAAVLILAVAGLSAGNVILWQQRQATAAALLQVRAKEEETQAQRRRTEKNFQMALRGATDILMQLDPRPGGQSLEGAALHRAIEEQGLRFFLQFIDEDNPDPAVRYESGQAYRLMASVYCARQDAAQAIAMIRKAIKVFGDLVEAYPEQGSYRSDLVKTQYLLGLMKKSLKQPREAHDEFARTAELCRVACRYDYEADVLNTFAWFLADSPDPTARDPALAADFAERAVAKEPGCGNYWNTLGVALYRAGRWAAAVAALEKSMELKGAGNPYDWFFLAMAHRRLGHGDQARDWFGKATRALDRIPEQPEDLLRYREEAAALLGD
jgi:tetratricopeptide (TPR) repeat protein